MKPINNAICLHFLYNDEIFFDKLYTPSNPSVYLWLNFNISSNSSNKKYRNQTITITNMNQEVFVEVGIKNGWNSIDISSLIRSRREILFQNGTQNDVFVVKCHKDCVVDVETKIGKLPIVYLNRDENLKPILQINNVEEEKNVEKNAKRSKRNDRVSKAGDNNFENEAVSVMNEGEMTLGTNLCKNNMGHPNRECCLVSHYVSFNALKWSNWVVAPSGYRANYCIGRCTTAKGKSFSGIV